MNGLLEGLEISILPISEVLDNNRDSRLDSQFFRKLALQTDNQIALHTPSEIRQVASKVLSFGAYALTNEFEYQDTGIPFLRGTNFHGDFVNFGDVLRISNDAHKILNKSEVKSGMVLLSMSGSVGSVAVALESWKYPINSNQDIAKIVPDGISPFYLAAYLASKHGQVQIERQPVGSVQQHIFLWMIERLKVPRFSEALETKIAHVTELAYMLHETVPELMADADGLLMASLGLADWTPPEPLTYAAKASKALAEGRLDARFFAPRIQALLDVLSSDGRTISSVAKPRREKFRPERHVMFDYIEISDMDGAGTTSSSRLLAAEAPSRATWHVRPGDIITSSVRPIRRLSAQILPEQAGFVCSSGFVVVNPQDIAPEVLLTYLRLPVICELLDLYASASMYPAITDSDIFNLPMPELPDAVATQIVGHVQNARAAKARAAALLDAAKRAVEIAIEDSETAAMAYFATVEGAN